MGRRELLLIAGFIALGVVVYTLTAPASPASGGGFSLDRVWREMHSEMGGGTHAPFSASASQPVDESVVRLRLINYRGRLTIHGDEQARTVAAELTGHVTAATDERASSEAAAAHVRLDPKGDTIDVVVDGEARRRTQALVLRIPERLSAQIEASGGPIEIERIRNVEIVSTGADIVLVNVPGDLRVEQRNGDLELRTAGSARLFLRNVEARVHGIREATVEGTDGRLVLESGDGRVRIDGRRLDVDVRMTKATQVDASTSDDSLTLVLPGSGGVTIDAIARDGDVRVDGPALSMSEDEHERRAHGTIDGGGPIVSLRTTRGEITIRK